MKMGEKQRVLHIIWNAKFGGIEKLVYELAQEQNKGSKIQAGVLIAQAEGEFLKKFQSANFHCHYLKLGSGFSLSWSSYKKALKTVRDYDVLHLHFFNPTLAFVMHHSKKQIVYTEHGNFGFGRKKKITDGLLFFLKKRFLNQNSLSITYNSQFTKNFAEKKYDLSQHPNSSLVVNGINFPLPNEEGKTNANQQEISRLKEQLSGQFVIGTCSRFAGFKRIDRLILAFSKTGHLENSILLLVGDGVLMQNLRKLVQQLKLDKKVVFTGFVEDVGTYQMLMDVCVFPSNSEPFGLVAVETLSLGKPTIVYQDGGGLVEIMNGISPDDIVSDEQGLIERIDFYKTEVKTGTNIKRRQDYARGYSIQRMAKELELIYQRRL